MNKLIPLYIISFQILTIQCGPDYNDMQDSFDDIVENSNVMLESVEQYQINLKQDIRSKILADSVQGVKYLDSLISNNEKLLKIDKANILILSGDILYTIGAYELSLNQFGKVDEITRFKGPDYFFYKARTFSKLGEFKKAKGLLTKALNYKKIFYWSIGNLYEMQQDTSNAIDNYNTLLKLNQFEFAFAKERITQLRNGDSLFNELDTTGIIEKDPKISLSR